MKIFLHRELLAVVALVFACAACQLPGTTAPSHAPVGTHEAGNVECPSGKAARPGLENFGAYIGTWDSNHPHDPTHTGAYLIRIVSGSLDVRCTDDDFVVSETMRPLFHTPEGQAVRIALTDLPADSEKVYDHRHSGCRVMQYRSAELAHQLGQDDADGHADIVFTSDGGTYTGVVKTILLDLWDKVGQDTRSC